VSIKSIENDKGRIKERLGLETRADIVKFVVEQGLMNVGEWEPNSAALSPKNMGGSGTARSAGEGQGATCTLELPANA